MLKELVCASVLIIGSMHSCSAPAPPSLNKEQKKIVDSLYRKGLDSIKKEIKLICDKEHTSIYQHAIDSIQNLRKEEFESILSQ